jgi:hypothetical protein
MANETNAEAFRQFLQQLPYYIPPVVIANLINLLFFICLLGAVEIFPLLFSLVMGRGPMGMSALSRAAVSPVVEPPIVSNSNEQHDVEVCKITLKYLVDYSELFLSLSVVLEQN